MKRSLFHILLFCWIVGGAAVHAGDQHPHRTITISGHCHSCDLARENLYGAEIMGAVFIEANLNHTHFNRATIVETRFIGSDLDQADFTGARLSGVLFEESGLHDVVFSHSHGERLRFDGSELDGAEFDNALLVLANFMSADLTGVNFTDTRLFHARFDGARLDEAEFTRARLPRAILRGVVGEDVRFVEADLRGADLTGAQIERGDFTGAMLQGAKLADAVLIDAVGLTVEMLYGACQTPGSQLPEAIELVDCGERRERQARRPERRPQPGWRFTITTDGTERSAAVVPGRSENVRLEVIRAEQARAIAEYEAMRSALEASREAIAAATVVAEQLDGDVRIEIQENIEAEIERTEEIEAEIREREALLVEALEDNEAVLRLIRQSGERLVYTDGQRDTLLGADAPSVIVDGHRYRLNGRYEWVVELPLNPEPVEPKQPDENVFVEEAPATPETPD